MDGFQLNPELEVEEEEEADEAIAESSGWRESLGIDAEGGRGEAR